MDATTADALAHVAAGARHRGGRLLLCGVRPGMMGTLRRTGALEAIGEDAVFAVEPEILASTHHAVTAAHRWAGRG
jgi:anti-anti-sigma regulatory factor